VAGGQLWSSNTLQEAMVLFLSGFPLLQVRKEIFLDVGQEIRREIHVFVVQTRIIPTWLTALLLFI
jgi:hypothetical protein